MFGIFSFECRFWQHLLVQRDKRAICNKSSTVASLREEARKNIADRNKITRSTNSSNNIAKETLSKTRNKNMMTRSIAVFFALLCCRAHSLEASDSSTHSPTTYTRSPTPRPTYHPTTPRPTYSTDGLCCPSGLTLTENGSKPPTCECDIIPKSQQDCPNYLVFDENTLWDNECEVPDNEAVNGTCSWPLVFVSKGESGYCDLPSASEEFCETDRSSSTVLRGSVLGMALPAIILVFFTGNE